MMLPIFGGSSSSGALDGKVSYIRCITAESKFFGQSVKATNANGEVKAVGIFSDEGIAVLAVGKSGVYTVTAESASNENPAGQVAETTVDVVEWYKVYDVIIGSNTSILKVDVYLTNLSDKRTQNTVYKLTGTDSTTGLEKTDTGKLQNEGQTTIYSTITGTCKFEVITQNGTGTHKTLDEELVLSYGTITEKIYRIVQNIKAISETDVDSLVYVSKLLNSKDIKTQDLPWAVGDEVSTVSIISNPTQWSTTNNHTKIKFSKIPPRTSGTKLEQKTVATDIKFKIVHILSDEDSQELFGRGNASVHIVNSEDTNKDINPVLSPHYIIGTTEKDIASPLLDTGGQYYTNMGQNAQGKYDDRGDYLLSDSKMFPVYAGELNQENAPTVIKDSSGAMQRIFKAIIKAGVVYSNFVEGTMSYYDDGKWTEAISTYPRDDPDNKNVSKVYPSLFNRIINNHDKINNDYYNYTYLHIFDDYAVSDFIFPLIYNAYEVYGNDYDADAQKLKIDKSAHRLIQFDYFKAKVNRIFTKSSSNSKLDDIAYTAYDDFWYGTSATPFGKNDYGGKRPLVGKKYSTSDTICGIGKSSMGSSGNIYTSTPENKGGVPILGVFFAI